MARPNPISKIMMAREPGELYLGFKPTLSEAKKYYKLLNKYIFNNQLVMPILKVERIHGCWGDCYGADDLTVTIRLNQKHISLQSFIAVLGHEMVHQYQWQIESENRYKKGKKPLMSHGPSFYKWRKKFERIGLPLNEGIYRRNFS